MAAYATLDDYEARYGETDQPERVKVLLDDASALIDSQPGFAFRPEDETQRSNLKRVTCSIAHRSMTSGDLDGVTQYSQNAVGYSAQLTYANPSGDLYITSQEKRSLGIGAGRIGETDPYGVVA
ncbi:Gp19/Gp15/Gp42 family protein [Thermophilibacter sp.]